jgi:DNA modification methylase
MTTWRILTGDVREMLKTLPDQSVQTCVTSPPYWGLRDYGVSGQLGLESTPEAYVAAMVGVFREVRRVLKDDGTAWLNLGDSYAGSGKGGNPEAGKQSTNRGSQAVGVLYGTGRTAREAAVTNVSRLTFPDQGIKQKDLVGIPWMVAFALRADGWYLRSDIIWSKPNPMPESVTDRPTKAHEYIFLLSKSRSYYYDADAIAEPFIRRAIFNENSRGLSTQTGAGGNRNDAGRESIAIDADGRNKRSVWAVATQPYPDAHFATYPEKLIEPCVLAGSAEGDTVLDPFTGSGTTGAVSVRLQRHFIGCELNPAYVELARTRIGDVAPLLAREVA